VLTLRLTISYVRGGIAKDHSGGQMTDFQTRILPVVLMRFDLVLRQGLHDLGLVVNVAD
jgi:hypothetical protein